MQLVRFFNTYEPVSTIFRDLAPALTNAGLAMEIVISSTEYRRAREGLDECIMSAGGRVVRIPSLGATAGSTSGKLWVMLTYSIGAMAYSLFGRRAAINVFLTQPPFFFAWAATLKVLRRQPFVVILMDMYPDAAVAHGSIRTGGLAHRVGRWIAGIGLRAAERVFVIGRCMANRVLSYGVDSGRVMCVPNWADESHILPIDRRDNTLAAELGIRDEFVVLYSGNMGVGHDFDDLLAVARRLKDNNRIRFVFIGDGVRREEVERYCHDHRLGNVLIRDFVSTDKMSESQSLGDVHFVSLREEFEGIMVPSKVYGALAAGRPIIYHGSPQSEVGLMVREESIGAVIMTGQVEKLEELLLDYAVSPGKTRQQGSKALGLVNGKYSRRASITAYMQSLGSIIDNDRKD